MAQAPLAAAMPANGAAGMPPDPSAGMGAEAGTDSGDVLVTICSDGQGGYLVYAGDESESGGDADMSEDDADLGPAGGAPAGGDMGGGMAGSAPQGQPADSIGAALKAAMTILQSDASSQGGPGNADDQLNAGFSASQSPTPASGAQKY